MPETRRRPADVSPKVAPPEIAILCEALLAGQAIQQALDLNAVVITTSSIPRSTAPGRVRLVLLVVSSAAELRGHISLARRRWPRARIVAAGVANRERDILDCFALPIHGAVLAHEPLSELAEALIAVGEGRQRLPPALHGIDRLVPAQIGSATKNASPLVSLSTRESQILAQLAQGKANKEIAQEFGVELQTVKNQVSRLFRKLGVTNRSDAARAAPPPPEIVHAR